MLDSTDGSTGGSLIHGGAAERREGVAPPPAARASGAGAADHVAGASATGDAGGAVVTWCFAGATFLGAFLLFLVQPLVAKYILPWYGGGATVWTTCMLFFQTALLGGYLYAHLGVSRLGTRGQAVVHAAVLLGAAAAALPAIAPAERWKQAAGTDAGGSPTVQILLLLAATVGLPCLALAATSPLLHSWYGRIRPGAAVYRLYALSNVGSLLALLAYPLAVEPALSRRTQAVLWSIGMAAFALLCAACALLAYRYASRGAPAPGATAGDDGAHARPAEAGPLPDGAVNARDAARDTGRDGGRDASRGAAVVRVALWLALPACASALLLATTNTMTQDLAPVPLLWVLPLALYLLTFVVAFDHPRWYHRTGFAALLTAGCAGVIYVLAADANVSAKVSIAVFSAVLFAACMITHGELARLRPPAARLTGYYLAIAAGGAIGGLLVAVGAPLLLRSYSEFPIALCACCVLAFAAPPLSERRAPGGLAGFVVPLGIVILGGSLWTLGSGYLRHGDVLMRGRDFYGVLSVVERPEPLGGRVRTLYHGSITHGQQFTDPERQGLATTYFGADSGIGLLLGDRSPLRLPRRVAVVGLGIGTIAAYARPGDTYHFFEISPNVDRAARQWFTYLDDAAARQVDVKVVIGDGRLSIERLDPGEQYDAIALDAFSGDAVPVHLLTLEAFELYAKHLAPGGVVAVQVSNRYLDLPPVIIAVTRRLGWHHVVVQSSRDADGYESDFILISPDPAPIEHVRRRRTYAREAEGPPVEPWTDEHASVLGALR